MELEKLEQLKLELNEIDDDILQLQERKAELEKEISEAQTMQDNVNAVPQAEDTRQRKIKKYYNPVTKTWSKEADKIFSANDKKELEKFF